MKLKFGLLWPLGAPCLKFYCFVNPHNKRDGTAARARGQALSFVHIETAPRCWAARSFPDKDAPQSNGLRERR